ncbi:hypothetical protein [Veillonella caviae]|uniref:hypothetical protein n=1 Tax=Veillonella caviae TaxID=248316 RepID=UPI000F8ECC28|nr:hypothetical protein [Veillonella caviae]
MHNYSNLDFSKIPEGNEQSYGENNKEIVKFIERLMIPTDEFKNKLEECLREVADSYQNNDRHSYANIFNAIIRLAVEDNSIITKDGSKLSNLIVNLDTLHDYFHERIKCDSQDDNNINFLKSFKKQFFKLEDHIRLEYARIAFWAQYQENVKTQYNMLETKISKSNNDADKINVSLQAAKTEIDSLRGGQIAVLGIFMTILLTVVAQVNYSGHLIAIAKEIEVGKVLLLLSLLFISVVNTIAFLLYIVSRLIHKNILMSCDENESCSSCKKCNFISKLQKRMPYVFWTNVLAFISVFLIWLIFYAELNSFIASFSVKHSQ